MSASHPDLMRPTFGTSSVAQAVVGLLLSPPVQKVQFRLGYLRRTSDEWTRLADALTTGRVKAEVDPTVVRAVNEEAIGFYDIEKNTIFLASGDVTATEHSRGVIIHECSHAIRDMRGGSDAIRHDEAAAFISEAMYHQAAGVEEIRGIPGEILKIAAALGSRSPGRDGVPHATRDEIISARQTVGAMGVRTKPYTNDFYWYDGVRGA